MIHSALLDKPENDTFISTNNLIKELAKVELRKRFAMVYTDKYVYIIGGSFMCLNRVNLLVIISFLHRLSI